MTELNIAYAYNGTNNNDDYKNSLDDNDYQSQQSQPQMPQQSQMSQQPQMPQQPQIPQMPQPQMPQQPQISNPQAIYYQQQPTQPIAKRTRYPEYSFWDRMVMSRNDVFKLVLLAFVIVLGMSIEKTGSHYITQYLADNVLSPLQEFIVRISFPVVIFIFLWIIKSL